MTEKPDKHEPEYLGVIPSDGKLHAVYPTALRTLCGIKRVDDNFWDVDPKIDRTLLFPTCPECQRVVHEWMPLQGSGIPHSWRRQLRGRVRA